MNFSVAEELSGATAARKNPEKYPGWWPAESFIIDAKNLSDSPQLFYLRPPTLGFQLEEHGADPIDLQSFRAGHLEVVSYDDHSYHGSLNQFLRDRGLAPMEQRVPVLAVGSNASPSQLAFKFKQSGLSGTIPSIRVSVSGYGVGFVPAVSSFGYVPATLVKNPDLKSNLFLQFLDSNQLVVMDKSEGVQASDNKFSVDSPTGYNREGIYMNLELAHKETLGFAYAYVARRGFISIGGKPVLCDNSQFGQEAGQDGPRLTVNEPIEGYLSCSDQRELIELVNGHDRLLAAELELALGSKPDSRVVDKINSGLLAFASPKETKDEKPLSDLVYGKLDEKGVRQRPEAVETSQTNSADENRGSFVALPTPNDVERKGESVVIMHPKDFEFLKKPTYVGIRSVPIEAILSKQGNSKKNPPEPIGRVHLADKKLLSSLHLRPGQVLIDEVLRVASGLHVGEKMALRKLADPMRFIRRAWFGILTFVLGKPNYVTGRVVLSDVTTMERDVALATPLTMQMLGIESGDSAVMEGVRREGKNFKIKTVSVRVFPLDEVTLENREKAQRGGWLSIIPDARLCLGVHSDLAPIFIDAALREFLFGKDHGQSVGVIRLRASFPEKISGEIRELAVVVLLAVLAWILTIPDSEMPFNEKIAAILATFFVAVLLILFRIRIRYRHTRRSRKSS